MATVADRGTIPTTTNRPRIQQDCNGFQDWRLEKKDRREMQCDEIGPNGERGLIILAILTQVIRAPILPSTSTRLIISPLSADHGSEPDPTGTAHCPKLNMRCYTGYFGSSKP